MNLENFDIYQKEIIKNSLADGINPSSFARPTISSFNMQVAAYALSQNINLSKYLDDFDFEQLNEIRLAIKFKLKASKIAIIGMSAREMYLKRIALMKSRKQLSSNLQSA